MSNRQWVEFNINVEGFEATLRDIRLGWGKLYQPAEKNYQCGCKKTTLDPAYVEGAKIKSGESYKLASCGLSDAEAWRSFPINNVGRGDAPCGTDGHFLIYDGDKAIAKVCWYNGFGSTGSRYRVAVLDPAYSVKTCDKTCTWQGMAYNSEILNNPGPRMLGYDLGKVKVVVKKN